MKAIMIAVSFVWSRKVSRATRALVGNKVVYLYTYVHGEAAVFRSRCGTMQPDSLV
jgi:hypothetical protein